MNTLEQRRALSERISTRAKITPPVFSENVPGWWERGMVLVLVKGGVAGRMFATWTPITKSAFEDEAMRSTVARMSFEEMRDRIAELLTENPHIVGPFGKLPV